jgi:3-methylfumaryl-CoA hydratase
MVEREIPRNFVGRVETAHDVVTDRSVEGLSATLDTSRYFSRRCGRIPVMLHWCLTPPTAPMSFLGEDGHEAPGRFLPPLDGFPRRMWAGGSLQFLQPICVGDRLERVSRIVGIDHKVGRTGPFWIVRIDHSFSKLDGIAVRERQDVVYRAASDRLLVPPVQKSECRPFLHSLGLNATPALLFRYSALSFNSHRIHYDKPYAIDVEGYDDLIVQGPLQATFLAEFAAELSGGKAPLSFSFRAIKPLACGAEFFLKADHSDTGLNLWVENAQNETTMNAKASW